MSDKANGIGFNSLTLGGFALAAALLLGAVNLLTAGRINEQQLAAERRALAEVFPANFHDNDLLVDSIPLAPDADEYKQISLLDLSSTRTAYPARTNEDFSGIILPTEAHDGYNGDIVLLVGILADGTISGVRVLEHRETPGLGDKIDADVSDWILGFDGTSLDKPPAPRWTVMKDGGDFDQLTGATVTPRAVIDAVRRALEFFDVNRPILTTQ